MMNKILLLIGFLFCMNNVNSQTVKFEKEKVLVDGKECLLNNSSDANNIELTTNDGKQTIFLKFIRTGIGHNGGLYTKIIFVEQNKSLTSKSYIFTKKLLVNKLISDKVLVDCVINTDSIDKFILKYDEKIEESLQR